MKKILSVLAVTTLFATAAMADDQPVQTSTVFSKFNLTIGGYVKLDYAYNSQNMGTYSILTPDNGQIGVNPHNAASAPQSAFGVEQTRLWFKIDGPGTGGNSKSSALVEGDFYGVPSILPDSPGFRLRQAYGTLDWDNFQLLFGQTWDMFGSNLANTIDFRSGQPYGNPWQRVPMVKLTGKVDFDKDNQLSVALAVVDPQQTGDNSTLLSTSNFALAGNQAPVTTTLPDLEAKVSFKSKLLGVAPGYLGALKGLTVDAFALYGHARYTFNTESGTKSVGEDSSGFGLYTFIPVLRSADGKSRANTLSIEGQIYEASNLVWNDATSQTLANTGADLYFTQNDLTQFAPMRDLGLYAQIIYYPTQDLGITVGYGSRIAINSAADFHALDGAYDKQDQQIYANVAYDFNSAVRVAGEYQHVETTYNNGDGRTAVGLDNIARAAFYYFF